MALGILHVGEETVIDLAEHFVTLAKLRKSSLAELRKISNIGPVAAKSIQAWFQNQENQRFVKKLLETGVSIKSYQKVKKPQKLSGLTFVLTGELESLTRDEAKTKIRFLGGDISGSVSKKTDFCVVGSGPGSKFDQAKKLGVKTIGEKEFLRIVS